MTKPSWLNIHTDLETVHDDNIATIRTSLVRICDGNYCAAIILDDFYFNQVMRIKCVTYEPHRSKNYQPDTTCVTNIPNVVSTMSGMFNEPAVIDALKLLVHKGYASIEISQDHYIRYEIFLDAVHRDLGVGRYNKRLQQIDVSPDPVIPEPQSAPIPQKAQRAKRKESTVVKFHNQRASSVALPATLTLEQWKQTLDDFNNKCAYCLTGDYEVLEHFIPLTFGGGTTEYNCVPACISCNSSKSDNHPSMIPASNGLFGALDRVRKYLESRKDADS